MKTAFALVLFWGLLTYLPAQSIRVKVNRDKDGNCPDNSISVYFIDTISNTVVDSLDLYDLNPYNHLPYESNKKTWNNTKEYQLNSFEEFDKLFPANYRQKYFFDYYVEPGYYNGLLSSTYDLSFYDTIANYIAVAYNLFAQPHNSDQIDGAISTIFVFDSKKNLIYKNENTLCVNNSMAVSNDGKYVIYSYGAAWSDGQLIKDGIQIVRIPDNEIVFQDTGYVQGIGRDYYSNIIGFSCYYFNGYERSYFFNTKIGKLFSTYQKHVRDYEELLEVRPDGLLFRDKFGKEYFKNYEKIIDINSNK